MITRELDYKIEKTKDNYDILRVNKDNRWVYVGSKYNMKDEIGKFIKAVGEEDDIKRVLVVYGFGAGEHIKALRDKFTKNKIIVFEPNKKLINYIVNINWVKKDKELVILCCEKDDLINNISKYIQELNVDFAKPVPFSNYENIYVYEINDFLKEIKDYYIGLRVNRNTYRHYSKRWFETLMANLPYMVDGTPIDFYKNKYKDIPAIIVSAGPSLEKNIDELKKIDSTMLILSGGRTLRSLMDKKIDFSVLAVADPAEISYELVKGYIENIKVPLLFYNGTNEKVVSDHKGEKLYFSNHYFIDRMAEMKLESFSLGGSVSHVMMSCAIALGCNPIILIGQDLAYTNDKEYASISENRNNGKKFEEVKDEKDLWVEDINGNKIRTSISLNQFRLAFENIIKENPNTTFINATEGGARIKGTIEMTLSEAIERYKRNDIKIHPMEKIKSSVNIKENVINALEEAKKSSKIIIGQCKKSFRYLKELKIAYVMQNNSKVNSILNKLDKIDEDIKGRYIDIEIIDNLLYPIIYDTLTAKTIDSNMPTLDEMKIIIEQNRKLYKGILDALEYAIDYIDKTLLILENKKDNVLEKNEVDSNE